MLALFKLYFYYILYVAVRHFEPHTGGKDVLLTDQVVTKIHSCKPTVEHPRFAVFSSVKRVVVYRMHLWIFCWRFDSSITWSSGAGTVGGGCLPRNDGCPFLNHAPSCGHGDDGNEQYERSLTIGGITTVVEFFFIHGNSKRAVMDVQCEVCIDSRRCCNIDPVGDGVLLFSIGARVDTVGSR